MRKRLEDINCEIGNIIVDKYNSGLSMKAIGNIFGLNVGDVFRILKMNNVTTRTKGGIYKLPSDEIIKRYILGETCKSISEFYGVSINSITKVLEDNNVPRNNKYKNKDFDDGYFDEIDRYDKAYFLGLMLTDGNISKNENIIRLALSSKDKEILEIFKEKTHNSNVLSHRLDEKHDEFIFQVRSSRWEESLAKYSVIPQKTFISDMPVLDENMMPHLIRGMIDGDGWISSVRTYIGFCGNEQTVTHFKDYIVNKLNVRNVKVCHPEDNLYAVQWSSRKDVLNICIYIYNDKGDCYLRRKYNNFLKVFHDDTEVNSWIAKGQESP